MEKRKRRLSADIWKKEAFVQIEEDKVKCVLCNKTMAKNTTSMKYHYSSQHVTEEKNSIIPLKDTVILWISTSGIPFSVVENEYFRKVLQNAKLSGDSVKSEICLLFSKFHNDIKETLLKTEKVNLCVDVWESKYGTSFLGLYLNFNDYHYYYSNGNSRCFSTFFFTAVAISKFTHRISRDIGYFSFWRSTWKST